MPQWDIRSLEKPKVSSKDLKLSVIASANQSSKITGYYKHPNKGIDHNLYVKNGLATLSNYGEL